MKDPLLDQVHDKGPKETKTKTKTKTKISEVKERDLDLFG